MSETFAAWSTPTTPIPSPPLRQLFEPVPTDRPNKVSCRACRKWYTLGGDDPAAQLREQWPAYAEWIAERFDLPHDAPRLPMPAAPNQACCTRCGEWTGLGDDPADTLREQWVLWCLDEQEKLDVAWRALPGTRAAAAFEAAVAAEHLAERQQQRDEVLVKQHRADRYRSDLRAQGWDVQAVEAEVLKRFGQEF